MTIYLFQELKNKKFIEHIKVSKTHIKNLNFQILKNSSYKKLRNYDLNNNFLMELDAFFIYLVILNLQQKSAS